MSYPPGDGRQPPQWQPGYPPPLQYAPDHRQATTCLVLGILGIVLCQVIAPFAWVMGKRTVAEIDAARGALGGRGAAQAGYVLGIVGTVLLGVYLAFIVGYFVLFIAIIGGGLATNS